MAGVKKKISILFQGDDQLSKKIKKIEKNINGFSDSVQKITQPLADIATDVLKTDAVMNAFVAGGLTYAIKKSIEFETAIVSLKKILGEQADQIDIIGDKALSLANKYGQSSTSIVESMTDFKRAGFDLEEISTLANDSMNLVLAASEAGFESAQATEILIATLKGFKAPAEDANRLVDIMNKVSNEYATSVTELGTGMSRLSPIAHKMGFTFEETAGILTPVIEIFRSGDEASTALKTGLVKLIDNAAPVQEALASIGVSQTDANGKLRSGKDILNDVAIAFQTLDKDQKLYVTSQLVGIRQSAKMVEVFDSLAYSAEITGVAMNAGGSALLEVTEKLGTGKVAIDRVIEGFNNLSIVVGTKFKESTFDVANGLADITNVMQSLVAGGAFDPIFEAIRDFGDKFKRELKIIAENLPEAFESVDYTSLIKSYDNLSDSLKNAIEAIFGEIDLTTPEGLANIINKIIDSMAALNNITAGIIDGMKPFLKLIGEGIEKFGELDEKTADITGKLLGLATGFNEILKHTKGIAAFFATLASATLVRAVGNISALVGSLGGLVPALAVLSVGALAAGAGVGLGYLASEMDDKITSSVGKAIDSFNELGSSIFGYQTSAQKAAEEQEILNKKINAAQEFAKKGTETVDALSHALTDSANAALSWGGAEALSKQLDDWGISQKGWIKENGAWINVKYKAELEAKSLAKTQAELDSLGTEIKIGMEEEARLKVEEELKALTEAKKIEFDLQVEKIKAQADIITTSLEWEAKLDIAQVEAATEDLKTVFNSADNSISSTGAAISNLFSLFAEGELGFQETFQLESQLRAEEKRRQDAFELQKKLTEQQIKLNDLRMARLDRGDALITIDGAGLQPHLEGFMWEILEAIQIRATSEGAEFLLGI